MNKARSVIASILIAAFKPKEKVSVSQWMENNIRLDRRTSANYPGRYSLNKTPYFRRLNEDIESPTVRKIVLQKSAQVGASLWATSVLLYYVCNFNFPLLYILPSQSLAQTLSERSIHPTINSSPAIQKFCTDNADDLKKCDFAFTSCDLRVIGGGSPSKLSSTPAAIVVCDEVDKSLDFETHGEAPALELAQSRTLSFPRDKKILVLSTPTVETSSIVHKEFLKGSQSRFFVPCPHCNHEQTLRFDQVKYGHCKLEDGTYDHDRVAKEAFYECEACKAGLTDRDKLSMIRNGVWKDTNPKPFPAEIRSYHISALYSPDITFGALAQAFLIAKDDIGKLRDFNNSWLGECFEQRAETLKPSAIDELIKLSPHYRKGELLEKPEVILMAVDTQGDHFYYLVEALFPNGTSAVIDWGMAATFADVEILANRQYPVLNTGEVVGIYKSLIDIGYKTEEVSGFIARMGKRFIGVRGKSEKHGMLHPVGENVMEFKGDKIPVFFVQDRYFKDKLYLSGFKHRSFTILFPQDTDDLLKKQITAENLVEKKNSAGRIETFWKCTNRMNHLGDCMVYLEGFKFRLEPILEAARQARERAKKEAENPTRQYHLNTTPYQASNGWD